MINKIFILKNLELPAICAKDLKFEQFERYGLDLLL